MVKESFELDPSHTVVGFSAKHLGVTAVRGRFWRFSGWFTADRDDLANATGEVTVEVASISTGEEQRDAHLRSPDFFAADTYPLMTFRLHGVRHQADSTYAVDGDLTIRETTRPVRLLATYGGEAPDPFGSGTRIGISAVAQVDRMDFGLNFDGLSGAVPMVAHAIDIQIDAELVTAPLSARAAVEAATGMGAWIDRMDRRELKELQRALGRMSAAVSRRLSTVDGLSNGSGAPPSPGTEPAPAGEPPIPTVPERRRGLFGRRPR